ncbi:MAG: hypothetical protein JOY90_25570 [Bradyrhizobium sp.]|uniref:hypothetical protein n=1 Tax=Bradyrhizobium sp. TaxID=376 RepID=UPI001DAB9141|nr:hypothetical protein [Bradyrhizobium sp.]MBV9563785.1 hypothetical protein [Bradyrhizobium sp.]
MRNISISRRQLLIGSSLALLLGKSAQGEELLGPLTPAQRSQFVLERRREAADRCAKDAPHAPETNGDESRYADRRANFAKTLPHNELGEVDQQAYRDWLEIVASGDPSRFEQVPRDVQAVERLNNPQAAYSIDLVGTDPAVLALAPPPCFASRAMAAELVELYWCALMRDVPFREIPSSPLTRGRSRRFDRSRLFRTDRSDAVSW